MFTPIVPAQRLDLRTLLHRNATLLSGSPAAQESLIDQTLRAAAYATDLNPDLSVADALFEIMSEIAKSNIRTPAYGAR